MRLDAYVNYRGTCEDAFRYYEQHLGGRIAGMVRHRDQPSPNIPENWKDKVLHARIEIGATVVMGADIPNAEPMRSAYLTLTLAATTNPANAATKVALVAAGVGFSVYLIGFIASFWLPEPKQEELPE